MPQYSRLMIITALIIFFIFNVSAIGYFYYWPRPPELVTPVPNPFKKIGGMATTNGLLVEVYSLRHGRSDCIIAVQMVPAEIGRASVQMQCR